MHKKQPVYHSLLFSIVNTGSARSIADLQQRENSMDVIDCNFADTSHEADPHLADYEDISQYIANMSAEMGIMAEKANLPMLSYLLAMVAREASNALMDDHPVTIVTPQ